MKSNLLAVFLACLVVAPALMSCMRKEGRTVRVEVPAMQSELDVRIVTNAALNEVLGRYAGRHECEIDVNRGIVLYHEGSRLLSQSYLRQIVSALARVGYDARVLVARHNPPPTSLVINGRVV